jgi:hypothetical protein
MITRIFKKPVIFWFITVLCLSPMNVKSHSHLSLNGYRPVVSIIMPEKLRLEKDPEKDIITKYSELLKTEEDHVKNHFKLYDAIDYWMGTRYTRGGATKSGGIDCSGLVRTLFSTVYNIKIRPTSLTQFCDTAVALFTNRSKCQLGDLIFFKTKVNTENRFNRVTHVGLYLTNGYFVQSSSEGVNIANLERGYWKNCYVAAGRLKNSYYQKAGLKVPEGEIKTKFDIVVEEDSKFEFIPYPEDLEFVIKEYSKMLNIDQSDIDYPEVFEFIEKNRYAPQNIISRCPGKLPGNNCLLTILFKDVFNYDLEKPEDNDFFKNNTLYQGNDKAIARFLDIIKLKSGTKNTKDAFMGIYLYNNIYVHIQDGDISISSLDHPVFENSKFGFYRFKLDISKSINFNIMEKRIRALQTPKSE